MSKMKYLTGFVAVALLAGCGSDQVFIPPSESQSGSAQVTVNAGKVGSLAKLAEINLAKLCIVLSASGETTRYDTIVISGNGTTTLSKTYNNLASLKSWTLAVKSVDTRDSTIHNGSAVFTVLPRQTTGVTMNLSARYSMLKANFLPIRDSVTTCSLSVDARGVAGSQFSKQTKIGDTVKLEYDYLAASPAPGTSHLIRMDVYGEMWGDNVLLYTGERTIDVVSGENTSYTITLSWVGPGTPPPGGANMVVVLGAIGTVIINGELTNGILPETVTDIDGNVYTTVTIGTQTWMVENLKTIRYNDGTPIPLVTDNNEWGNLSTPGYCWYNNDISKKEPFGALYNWYAVNTGKLAPPGWHVPTWQEWLTLEIYLGGEYVAGGKMKDTGSTYWGAINTGATNESGFTGLPGGLRAAEGFNIDGGGFWWSSTEFTQADAGCRYLWYINSCFYRFQRYKALGCSVRLIKD